MPDLKDVLSAGVVAFGPGKRVLLVHRPRYDDWSFPKGKLDPGEHPAAAAVREVAEETGLHVRLGPPLRSQRYPASGRMKTVTYWTGRPVGDHDVSGYLANDEIDGVTWLSPDKAAQRLTYARDVETLHEALRAGRRTVPVVVLRHGQARSRKPWQGDDRLRPLVQQGLTQAQRLVPVLAAYDVRRVVSSSSTRCLQTVAPYADASGCGLEQLDQLSEEDATEPAVARIVKRAAEGAVADRSGLVLCTHRTVLPLVFEGLGLEDPGLEKGEMLVAHLRKRRVVAAERHLVG